MFNFAKTSAAALPSASRRLVILDLDASAKNAGPALGSKEPAFRELDADEVLFVAGGMRMTGRSTCSGGCEDDC